MSNAKHSLIAIHRCVLGVDGGVGNSSGGVVVVVVGVVGLVVGYLWWRSGGVRAGDSLCKGGSCNRCRSALGVRMVVVVVVVVVFVVVVVLVVVVVVVAFA